VTSRVPFPHETAPTWPPISRTAMRLLWLGALVGAPGLWGCTEAEPRPLEPPTVLGTIRGIVPFAIAFVLLALLVTRRRTSGQRLHQLYPAVPAAPGSRLMYERVVFGNGPSMTWVRLTADHAYLHVSVAGLFNSTPAFSVPLADVSAAPNRFPLMILAPDVIKLSFARDPGLPILVWPHVFDRLTEASGGRLRLTVSDQQQ
jgi:hypothetical protein